MQMRNGRVTDDLASVRPGDALVLFESITNATRYRPPTERPRVTVARVGRVLVHVWVDPARPERGTIAYRIADGRKNTKHVVGAGPDFVQTEQFYNWTNMRRDLLRRLAAVGVDVEPDFDRRWSADRLSTEQLRALLAVVEGERS